MAIMVSSPPGAKAISSVSISIPTARAVRMAKPKAVSEVINVATPPARAAAPQILQGHAPKARSDQRPQHHKSRHRQPDRHLPRCQPRAVPDHRHQHRPDQQGAGVLIRAKPRLAP